MNMISQNIPVEHTMQGKDGAEGTIIYPPITVYRKKASRVVAASTHNLALQLRKEKNPIKSNMLSNKIKYLYNDIDTKYIQIVNIENLLETIELEKRKQQHQLRRYY